MEVNEIKVDPEELRANVNTLASNVRGMNSVIQQFEFSISKNTCKNITEFKTEVDNIKTQCSLYTSKFQQNLTELLRCAHIIEDMDKKISEAVDSQSAAAQFHQSQNQ